MSISRVLMLVPSTRLRPLLCLQALAAAVLLVGLGCRTSTALTFEAAELDSVAQFLARHAETMRKDGAQMIVSGQAHDDAHVIADGQHQIADAGIVSNLRDQVLTMAAELRRNPLTGSQLNVERALANGRSLQAEGDALKAHADAMVAHGNLMTDLSHQPGSEWMLEGAEAMLRDSLELAQVAKRLQDVGAAMVQFAQDINRSVGAR